jgi:serine/threonine-protein kinase
VVGYQVLRKLADGSAAEVFLASAGASPARVVLEVIRPELTSDFEVYGRFLDEAKDRQSLAHPALLRRTTTGCAADGRLYAVTEPIDGEHLGNLLMSHGPLSPAELVPLFVPLCEALEYLHARGKMHGHLRPANVFLVRSESGLAPKLLDTGLSLLRPGKSIITSASLVLVEPEYLSPERIRGRRTTVASDVYGLGVLMYEALTGAPPFTSADPTLTRRMHLEEEPAALPSHCERLAPIVMRCLAKNPARRYESVAALQQALAWHAGGASAGEVVEREAAALEPSQPHESVDVAVEDLAPHHAAEAVHVDGEPVGELLGSYELEDLLGQGGMGRVFLARHVKLGRRVALKVLRPELAVDPGHLERFFQEARAVNRVNHEHIVQIFDFVEEPKEQGGRVYCVMEPLAGKSLRDLAHEGPLPIQRAVGIVRQVCSALQAAHDLGVVHRDVKPDNIFLVESGGSPDFVKLLDFGIAKLEAFAGDPAIENTRSGVVVGTPSFMAPEQVIGDEVDGRADIYSLGTVLYSLLVGKRPFEAPSMEVLLTRLVTKPAPPLPAATLAAEPISAGLRALVAKCLEKKPARRFQTMAELSAALLPFDAPRSLAGGAPVIARSPPQRPARWPWLVGAALALAAAAAAGVWIREPLPPAVAPVKPAAPLEQAPAQAPAPASVEAVAPTGVAAPKVEPPPAPAPSKKRNKNPKRRLH